mmetsp:Transcript_33468/g.75082  ORF Transcript_33468/g.75082 Transcript_33468/m.75082 type:complete len:586 (-) Transcript_33468:147-1904(-)
MRARSPPRRQERSSLRIEKEPEAQAAFERHSYRQEKNTHELEHAPLRKLSREGSQEDIPFRKPVRESSQEEILYRKPIRELSHEEAVFRKPVRESSQEDMNDINSRMKRMQAKERPGSPRRSAESYEESSSSRKLSDEDVFVRKGATKGSIASTNKLANGLGLTADIQDRTRQRDRPTSPTMRRQQERPQSPPALGRRPVSPPGLMYKQSDPSAVEKGRGKDSPTKRPASPPASPRRPLSPKRGVWFGQKEEVTYSERTISKGQKLCSDIFDEPAPETPQKGVREPELAVEYYYSTSTDTWAKEKVLVDFSDRPFARGAQNVCFEVKETKPDGSQRRLVAKMPVVQLPTHAYFDDAMTHVLARDYADAFNAEKVCERNLSFVEVFVLKLSQRDNMLIHAESMIDPPKHSRHANKSGYVDDSELSEAFAHFTWEASGKRLLIDGIRKLAGDVFCDPCVHSSTDLGFGRKNQGIQGIDDFFRTHRCNTICLRLGLDRCDGTGEVRRSESPDSAPRPPRASALKYQGPSSSAEAKGEARPSLTRASGRTTESDASKSKNSFLKRAWSRATNIGANLRKGTIANLVDEK